MDRRAALAVIGTGALLGLTGCAAAARPGNAIRVVYLNDGNPALGRYMARVAAQFRAAHPSARLDMAPVQATDQDYYTKVALMNRSVNTAPDVIYEDTFQVKADAAAGYLEPLDPYLAGWDGWPHVIDAAREAAAATTGSSTASRPAPTCSCSGTGGRC